MAELTIIVPVYNTEKYLAQCVESLLAQNLKDIQILLVDDGSTDKSGKICDSYSKIDRRIQVIHKENGGLSDARNAGMEQAEADYLGFVDSDDYVEPDFFRRLYEEIKESGADLAAAGIRQVEEGGKVTATRCVEKAATLDRHDGLKELFFSKRISNSVCNKIFKKELFQGITFPVGKLYEDEYVTYRLFERASKVRLITDVFYFYRSNPKSITHSPFSEREFDRIYASELKLKFCEANYPDLQEYVQYYLVYDCAWALAKMNFYKKEYDPLIRKNIRKYWKVYVKGDNSAAAKLFVLMAGISPGLTVLAMRILRRIGT